MDLRELIEGLEGLLDLLERKAEIDRTKREEQILELTRAMVEALRKWERADGALTHFEEATVRVVKSANEVVCLAKKYNEANREYDLRNLDAETLAAFRKGKK